MRLKIFTASKAWACPGMTPKMGTGHHSDNPHSDNHYSDNLSFSTDSTIFVNGRNSFCLIGISTRNISYNCTVNVRNTFKCFPFVTFKKFSPTSLPQFREIQLSNSRSINQHDVMRFGFYMIVHFLWVRFN